MSERIIREPGQIRLDAARKLRAVHVSDHFQAILGSLLGEDWTTPRLAEMVITSTARVANHKTNEGVIGIESPLRVGNETVQ